MTNLVRWLAAREEADRVRAAPEKPIYRYGESPRFTARVFDGTLAPRPGAWTVLELGPASGAASPAAAAVPREPVVLEEVEGAPGTYRASLAPLPPGRYRWRASAT